MPSGNSLRIGSVFMFVALCAVAAPVFCANETAEVRLYNQLFAKPDPDVSNFAAELNPNSLEVLSGAKLEPARIDLLEEKTWPML